MELISKVEEQLTERKKNDSKRIRNNGCDNIPTKEKDEG